jgi:2'-5' RNA ligase
VSERLRLFVALDVPQAVRAALAAWCERVAPKGVRRVPAENLHLTLAFLGSRSVDEAAEVGALLAPVAAWPVGSLATAEALWLPPRSPGVLTVAIDAGDGLDALRSALVARLREAIAFEPERRTFRPHLTVGRVPRGAHVAVDVLRPPPQLEFEPCALTLYRSQSGRGGARYEALASAVVSS